MIFAAIAWHLADTCLTRDLYHAVHVQGGRA